MKLKVIWVIIVAMVACQISMAADWPQYLGPQRNSTSAETGLLRTWPQAGPEVLWTVDVGRGYGGPAIKVGKVYLLDRNDEVGEALRCFNLADGQELWSFAYDAPGTVMFPGSRTVPTIDGEYIYTCGHNGDLHCISSQSQKPVWKANIWTDFGGKPASTGGGFGPGASEPGSFPIWAITQNPLIYGDLLIVASQAPEAGVVAYDKLTGKINWKTPSLGYVGYVSPSIVKIEGNDQLVMVTPSTNPFRRSSPDENKRGKFVGFNPLTGEQLWEYDNWNCHISVAPAIDAGENRLLVVGGYELGATMVKVEKAAAGNYQATEVFTTEEFGDQTKPPILHNGHLYAQYGTNNRRDGLVCMSLDGEIKWKTRRFPSFNKGSMILVDGLILATDGEKSLFLIEPDLAGFKPLASAELLKEGGDRSGIAGRIGGKTQNWAPLAFSEGRLLIRDHTQLKCVKVAK